MNDWTSIQVIIWHPRVQVEAGWLEPDFLGWKNPRFQILPAYFAQRWHSLGSPTYWTLPGSLPLSGLEMPSEYEEGVEKLLIKAEQSCIIEGWVVTFVRKSKKETKWQPQNVTIFWANVIADPTALHSPSPAPRTHHPMYSTDKQFHNLQSSWMHVYYTIPFWKALFYLRRVLSKMILYQITSNSFHFAFFPRRPK